MTPPAQASLPTSTTIGYNKRLMVFSGRANRPLAEAIARQLGVSLGRVVTKTFTGQETYCRYEESVRGADMYIIQPLCVNEPEGMSPNDSLMELLLMIDAAVGAGAHRVIAVCPWYGYSRQDKKSAPREPISARVVARMIEAAGAHGVVTMDLHAGQIQGFFTRIVEHTTALGLIADHFRALDLPDLVVVSPDAGRAKLSKKLAGKLGADLAILNKERPNQQEAEISTIIGDVRGKTAVIVDDIIDTAGTLCAGGRAVLGAGATSVYAGATHPVLSGAAYENLATSPFEQIVVCDTIPLREGAPKGVVTLSVASLLTDSIRRIFTDDSVSEVFGGDNQVF